MEALLPFIHPDFEVTTPAGLAAEPDTYRGPEGIRRYFESFYEAMDEVGFEPEEFTASASGWSSRDPVAPRAHHRDRGRQEVVQVW